MYTKQASEVRKSPNSEFVEFSKQDLLLSDSPDKKQKHGGKGENVFLILDLPRFLLLDLVMSFLVQLPVLLRVSKMCACTYTLSFLLYSARFYLWMRSVGYLGKIKAVTKSKCNNVRDIPPDGSGFSCPDSPNFGII